MHASVSACVRRGQLKQSVPESNTGSSFESVARRSYRFGSIEGMLQAATGKNTRHAGPD